MAEMPPYTIQHVDKSDSLYPGAEICDPQCKWTCGPQKECDEVCEPVCLPPQCKLLCHSLVKTCETRCGAPSCAVVCPTASCKNGDCPKCRTICGPPACTTQCGEDCQGICSDPQCTWKCHPGTCPKPTCKLTCSGIKSCATKFPPARMNKVPLMPGQEVINEGKASLNMAKAMDPGQAPPLWITTSSTPKAHLFMRRHRTTTVPPVPDGPVRRLKNEWNYEDVNRNMRHEGENLPSEVWPFRR